MNDTFTCPCCKKKLPFRVSLSMDISMDRIFACPHCKVYIKSEKVAISAKVAMPLGMSIGLLAVILFRIFFPMDRAIHVFYIVYAIFSLVLLSVMFLLAAYYTYKKTKFIEV